MYNIETLEKELKKQLDQQQFTIATTRTETGYRRVKGPAGSGKSLGLAGRAAMLACEGKRVLVCNHNIALLNYLKSLVEGFIPQEVSQQIIFDHLHSWCRYVCENTGYKANYNALWLQYDKQDIWKYRMPKLVSDFYEEPNTLNLPFYDAILVDEGHDFEIFWWQTLRKAVKQDGEMLLVADKTQDIHGTAQAWTEERMKDCGFSGDWMRLRNSYRLPARIIPILEDFSRRFPYDGEIDIPPPKAAEPTDLFDKFRWVQVPQWKSPVDACLEEVERLCNDPEIPSVCFLSEKNIGMPLVNEFKQRGKDIFSTHSEDWGISREAKLNLRPGCAEIVATTVDSFKGWETPHLVVYVNRINSDRDRSLFYTALSRLNKHPKGASLTVVSSCPELKQFGQDNFPDFDSASLGVSIPNIVEVNDIPF